MARLKDKWSQRIKLPSGQILVRDVKCVLLREGVLHGKVKLDLPHKHYLCVTSSLTNGEWAPTNPSDPDLTTTKWRSKL